MKKAVLVVALIAVPAGAQERRVYHASDTWPVEIADGTCTMANAATSEASNPLTLSYDAASGEIVLTVETTDISDGLEANGSLELAMVFLDNGSIKYDDGWDPRSFGYTHDGGVTRFVTRFAGERPVRQILADIAGSKHLGLLHRGKIIASTDLGGAASSVAQLRACARQVLAAN